MDELKWQARADFKRPTNPLQALTKSYSTSSKDMGKSKFDAWIYGIVVGWDDDSYDELSVKHSWSKEDVEYNKLLHKNYRKSWTLFMDETLISNKCPECLEIKSKDELKMFGGLCEECNLN